MREEKRTPDPPQTGHGRISDGDSAPVPWQCLQTTFRTNVTFIERPRYLRIRRTVARWVKARRPPIERKLPTAEMAAVRRGAEGRAHTGRRAARRGLLCGEPMRRR
jgi:hypothetical protein